MRDEGRKERVRGEEAQHGELVGVGGEGGGCGGEAEFCDEGGGGGGEGGEEDELAVLGGEEAVDC